MYLEWLQLACVRNLPETRIEPGPHLNLFTGRNASGKTALLESLYLLARARSFRTPRIAEVIQRGQHSLRVSARVAYQASHSHYVTGIEKARGKTRIRFNETPVRNVSEQARHLPLVLLTPDSQNLLLGSPRQRRHWLDWALFHVEPDYLELWRQYYRALRHRNALLKKPNPAQALFIGWEQAMAETGARITKARQRFCERLAEALCQAPARDLHSPDVELQMQPGFPGPAEDLAALLAESRTGDRTAGFSRHGPHRADLLFHCDADVAAAVLSRGQLKLFVCRLLLAEAMLLAAEGKEKPLLLVDDYSAELDSESSRALLQAVGGQGWQCFVTASEYRHADIEQLDLRRFHVEHGAGVKVVE